MPDRTMGFIYIAVLLALSFVFQYQMKLVANELASVLAKAEISIYQKASLLLHNTAALIRLVAVLGVAALLFAFWLLALTKLELSVALPLASIALVLNAVGNGIMLGEAISLSRIIGVVTVAAGIALVLRS